MTDSRYPLAVAWLHDRPGIDLLDQTFLPHEEVRRPLDDLEGVFEAIANLRVRGAPAIGVTAAMGLAATVSRSIEAGTSPESPSALLAQLDRGARVLEGARPTARNLSHSLRALLGAMREWLDQEATTRAPQADLPGWACHPWSRALVGLADDIRSADAAQCRQMGMHGADLFPSEGVSLLTHCNTGALATAGSGTALAAVYELHARGVPVRVYACEARPVLQGARLTAWELQRAGIEVTLITDSMAGALMAEGQVDAVILGADAVCANGDVVNKIGTYTLALLAQEHGLPFYVAAPRTTVDKSLASGAQVPIEERSADEVRFLGGVRTAPPDVAVWNPAFDRTPAHLITALITDAGILRPPFGPAIQRLVD